MANIIDKEWTITPRGVGLPDYSTASPVGSVPSGEIFTSNDPGELAARLGSPVTYDRRGNVIFATDFQSAQNNFLFLPGFGAGALIEESAEISQRGGTSLKVCSGVGSFSIISWSGGVVGLSKVGVCMSFCSMDFNFDTVGCTLSVDNGDRTILASYAFNLAGQIGITNNMGNFVVLDTLIWPWGNLLFTTIKIVFDLETGRYERLLVDNRAYDITAYNAQILGPGLFPTLNVSFTEWGAAAATSQFYHNSFVVTQNEPINI